MEINQNNYRLTDKLITEDLVIKGNNTFLKGIVMKGKIIIYSANNYLEEITFCEGEGIIIYPKGQNNQIVNSHFNKLQYGITIYGKNNDVKSCFFCENEYPMVLLGDTNRVYNCYFLKNHHPIIDKAHNRIVFNVFNKTSLVNNHDSNKVVS